MKVPKFPSIKGVELYLVGGCVRDSLMGQTPKDLDYVMITDKSFEEVVKQISETPNCKVFQAKAEFLTIRCKIQDQIVDLVMPRTEEGYSDHRRPDEVKGTDSLFEDSKRRDFTINSMYMDKEGTILDYHKGVVDLKNKVIKCVGNPRERFQEDYLRILRAVRFSCRFGFKIDKSTQNHMIKLSERLTDVEQNRVREELNKSLKANPKWTMKYIEALNLYKTLSELGLHFELSSKGGENDK